MKRHTTLAILALMASLSLSGCKLLGAGPSAAEQAAASRAMQGPSPHEILRLRIMERMAGGKNED